MISTETEGVIKFPTIDPDQKGIVEEVDGRGGLGEMLSHNLKY